MDRGGGSRGLVGESSVDLLMLLLLERGQR